MALVNDENQTDLPAEFVYVQGNGVKLSRGTPSGVHAKKDDRQTDRQAGRQTDRQTEKQIAKQANKHCVPSNKKNKLTN